MSLPNQQLLEAYGTIDVLAEKLAGQPSVAERVAIGIVQAVLGHRSQLEARRKDAEDELRFHRESAAERGRLEPALASFRRRSPVFLSPGQGEGSRGMLPADAVPMGMDEGMVRLAAAATRIGQEMAKQSWNMAAIAEAGKTVAQGARKFGKNLGARPGGIKGQLAMGAGAIGLGVLGSKAIDGARDVMEHEGGGPATYGPGRRGGPSLAFGVNAYGQPQLGTPLM